METTLEKRRRAQKAAQEGIKATFERQKLERREKYLLNPTRCKQCDSLIPYEKKNNIFCSHSCAASFTNKGVRKWGKEPGICLICENPLKRNASKYCSKKCQNKHSYDRYILRWRQGLENGSKGESISNHIRFYLKEKFNDMCQKCGWNTINPKTGKAPLTIHHVDGDWRNNKEDNLQLLCPNCHSITDTYGALNRGNGRQERQSKRKIKASIV